MIAVEGQLEMVFRKRLLGIALLLCIHGCAQPLQHGARTRRGPARPVQTPCRTDLILVGGTSPSRRPAFTNSSPAPHLPDQEFSSVTETASRYTVAIRGVRLRSRGKASASMVSSEKDRQFLVEGSGVIIDTLGLVLTNFHVVREVDDLEVWVAGLGWTQARLVGADPLDDLAVLSIDRTLGFAASLGRGENNALGQEVVAVGYSPGELPEHGPTALSGEVTAWNRSLQTALDPSNASYYGHMIESTVPLKPGHSGGPLVDSCGRVIGINTAAVTRRSTGRRTGYAIPMTDYILSVVERLTKGMPVDHSYLGVGICACPRHRNTTTVQHIMANSPAATAGLRIGDSIITFNGQPVSGAAQLAELVRSNLRQEQVRLSVERSGQMISVDVALWSRR